MEREEAWYRLRERRRDIGRVERLSEACDKNLRTGKGEWERKNEKKRRRKD